MSHKGHGCKADRELALAERALIDRGDEHLLKSLRAGRCCRCRGDAAGKKSRDPSCYERCYELVPLHRELDSWLYVSRDPQLALVVEEIVNAFSPALSMELLLHNMLGSNSRSATCLVRYLLTCYATEGVCEHIKTTLRNMVRWMVLAGFVPVTFLPWQTIGTHALGLSGEAAVLSAIAPRDASEPSPGGGGRLSAKRARLDETLRLDEGFAKPCERATERARRACLRTAPNGLSAPEAALEALQEKQAHEGALVRLLRVPTERTVDTLALLMDPSVPKARAAVVCKIIDDWVGHERPWFAEHPARSTELKMATVTLWGFMKTFEHGRCPVVPECRPRSCLAFYDKRTALVTALVDGTLYVHSAVWNCGGASAGRSFSSLAGKAHATARNWRTLFRKVSRGLKAASSRRLYTSTGNERSSVAHAADVILSADAGPRSSEGSCGRPLVDRLSRSLACNRRSDMLGLLTEAELPEALAGPRVGACSSVSQHKSASVAHSLSEMVTAMISEGKEVQLVREFLEGVVLEPARALSRIRSECKDRRLLRMAACVASKLQERRLHDDDSDGSEDGREDEEGDPAAAAAAVVTELGSDVKLVCSYPAAVTVAHLEEILSLWTNYWRSALSGFCHYDRRHNTIRYSSRDTGRELESGSPAHIFHRSLVALLNTSGTTFADSLAGRKPDTSLSVNEIMLTKDSLHPAAYGLLLASKLGLRPSDVKTCDPPKTSLPRRRGNSGGPAAAAAAAADDVDDNDEDDDDDDDAAGPTLPDSF